MDLRNNPCLHLKCEVLKAGVEVAVPYLISKLPQPVRLQQQSEGEASTQNHV